ncbi:hypothetical protein NP493_11g07030 [Ridgeia piscesae]|uniref:Macro domain-containing protein n=1 Tax=Ridgeia piscesae TaxID=27915 RepID=A0AAD9UL73_RIDPI|nr:hypothetical protein NP493_11g07030 [Ridgeia piscesae]
MSASRPSNIVLDVQHGDLTRIQADVLVNTPATTDKDLTKCGQVSKAFCKTGGDEMQKLYKQVFSDSEDLMVTVSCGQLKCGSVFHMRIPTMKRLSYPKLGDQIYRCLQKASEQDATSIAFPTVGCGKLGYDAGRVTDCFKQAVKKHSADDVCSLTKVCRSQQLFLSPLSGTA